MKIRLLPFVLFAFLSIFSCGSKKKEVEKKYGLADKEEGVKKKHYPTLAEIFSESISVDDLDYHVYNLASDSLKGRKTGSKGQKDAADYIWKYFTSQGILFPKQLDGFFQKFTVSQNNMPTVTISTDAKDYVYGDDFISFFPHDSISFSVKNIIYAGYGIDTYRYSDYSYQDVKGKVVVIIGGEPKDKYGNYIISDNVDPYTGKSRPSEWSLDPIHSYILKRNAAMKHGAKALFIYDKKYHDFFWKNFAKNFADRKVSVSVEKDSVFDFFISKEVFADLTGYDRGEDIEYSKKTRKFTVPISLNYKNTNKIIETENVIGIIPGEKKSDRFLIILSHYDGLGSKGGIIYPGADDNATGVAASFEIAEAFKQAIDSGFIPKRNILFVNTSGHELDLLGARYYLQHPVVPLEKTDAVIELHKLGRLREGDDVNEFFPLNIAFNGFQKKGFKSSINHIQSYNEHMTIKFKSLIQKSDYTLFMNKHIPVVYFFGDKNPDFHKPEDTPKNVSYAILEERTRFIFQIIWELAYAKKL